MPSIETKYKNPPAFLEISLARFGLVVGAIN
jgi:hypothetical protein